MRRTSGLGCHVDDEYGVVTQYRNREAESSVAREKILDGVGARAGARYVECHGMSGFRGQGTSVDSHQHVAGMDPSCSRWAAGNYRDHARALVQRLSGDHTGTVGQLELRKMLKNEAKIWLECCAADSPGNREAGRDLLDAGIVFATG